jgi:hypothetical protein
MYVFGRIPDRVDMGKPISTSHHFQERDQNRMEVVAEDSIDHTNLLVLFDSRRSKRRSQLGTAAEVLVDKPAQLLDYLVHDSSIFGRTDERSSVGLAQLFGSGVEHRFVFSGFGHGWLRTE